MRASKDAQTARRPRRWRTDPALWAKIRPIARELRTAPTEAEDILWQRLRAYRLQGLKFRRQHPIERFIVDFYCAEAGFVIEIDGPIHQYQREEDAIRREFIESQGLRLIRFSNNAVIHNLDKVLSQISSFLPHPL